MTVLILQDVLAGNIAMLNMAARLMAYTDVRDVAQVAKMLKPSPCPKCAMCDDCFASKAYGRSTVDCAHGPLSEALLPRDSMPLLLVKLTGSGLHDRHTSALR